MSENIVCKECLWNNYPECLGSLFDGIPMKIDELPEGFMCGQKDNIIAYNQLTNKSLEEKIDELESRMIIVEAK